MLLCFCSLALVAAASEVVSPPPSPPPAAPPSAGPRLVEGDDYQATPPCTADAGPFACLEPGCPSEWISCAQLAAQKACGIKFDAIWQSCPSELSEQLVWQACPVACVGAAPFTGLQQLRAAFPPGHADAPWWDPSTGELHPRRPPSEQGPWPPTAFEVLSESPRMYYYPRFLSEAEVDHLVNAAIDEGMHPSQHPGAHRRLSVQIPFERVRADAVLTRIAHRISAETKAPTSHFHWLKAMVYEPYDDEPPQPGDGGGKGGGGMGGGGMGGGGGGGGMGGGGDDDDERRRQKMAGAHFYFPHLDDRGQQATLLMYLSDVDEGGETIFGNLPAMGHEDGFTPLVGANTEAVQRSLLAHFSAAGSVAWLEAACAQPRYLKVPPRRGAALLWFNTHANGTVDGRTAHAACPVRRGRKVIGQQWVLSAPFAEAGRGSAAYVDGLARDAKGMTPTQRREGPRRQVD